MNKVEANVAMAQLKGWRERFAQHEEACEEDAKNGHRPSHCVHGTYLWTDYDPMCWACEEGYGYWDYQTYLDISRNRAKDIVKEYNDMISDVIRFSNSAGNFVTTNEQSDMITQMVTDAMNKANDFLNSHL